MRVHGSGHRDAGGDTVRLTYDANADAAYVYLTGDEVVAPVAKTVPVDPAEAGGMIDLDFDGHGRLIGIEILDASTYVAPSLLETGD